MSNPNSTLKHHLTTSLHHTNTHLLHLSRLLSSTAGLEATLATSLFSLTLLYSQLSRLLARQRENLALAQAFKASHSSRPEATIVATLTLSKAGSPQFPPTNLSQTCAGILSLARACDEFLMFLRLFGLLQIYTWAHSRYTRPPRDPIIKLLVWAQILSSAVFQGVENTAYLARKGVVRGAGVRNRTVKLIALGNKFWLMQHVLEVLRLLRVRQLRWNEDFGAESTEQTGKKAEGIVEAESEELKKQWQRDVWFNVSWLPIRLHASHEDEGKSPVTDTWFGIFGLLPSLIMLQDAWRASA